MEPTSSSSSDAASQASSDIPNPGPRSSFEQLIQGLSTGAHMNSDNPPEIDTPGAHDRPARPKISFSNAALAGAVQQEHALAFRDAIKLYPAAIGWSMFVSIGVIMLAFDPQIVGSMFAMPQFKKDFGVEYHGEVCQWGVRLANCSVLCSQHIPWKSSAANGPSLAA
jgi:hypothetical protein